MQYAFMLRNHANVRYRASLEKLAVKELLACLNACGVSSDVTIGKLGGADFLRFECPTLPDTSWPLLAAQSAIGFFCTVEGGMLTPIEPPKVNYLPDDIAEVLKYKGKTSAAFTQLMITCALCAGDFAFSSVPLTVLDPICGKGTSLFCAAQRGMNAVGIEMDKAAIKESVDYFTRYLQLHQLKHRVKASSLTIPGQRPSPETMFTYADTPENYKADNTRSLRFVLGDTLNTSRLVKPASCHLLVADLPYGVQHAPHEGRELRSLPSLLRDALPGWFSALCSGGAAALSFNAYTLKKDDLASLMTHSGFTVLTQPPYDDYLHWVEQAVNRDMLIAVKK